jgi:L-2-hydroxyglutarate oxidase LhgO
MADYDCIVVGAGAVGLAIARHAALAGQSVLVLEQAASAGTETSARNSEVIHAGLYYGPGTLKTRLCVEGRRLLYEYCAARGIAAKRVGKLIVATSPAEEAKLESIAALAYSNGVDDLQWLSGAEAVGLEPELRCTKALFSPSTGILDSRAYMLSLQSEAEGAGCDFAFQCRFVEAEAKDREFLVRTRGAAGEVAEVSCRMLINCAGHGAHEVARAIGGYPVETMPPRYLAKGNYCGVSGSPPFRHLVYPVPVAGALGVHATLDQAGAVRFGPDIEWIDKLDYSLSPDLAPRFAKAIRAYWPGVDSRELLPSYCGIRPKIHGPEAAFADFCIQGKQQHGIHGLMCLFGIESPGLTSSLAIAQLVMEALG